MKDLAIAKLNKETSGHLMDKCQSTRNEPYFCSILEACSHPKLLTHLYIDVSCKMKYVTFGKRTMKYLCYNTLFFHHT